MADDDGNPASSGQPNSSARLSAEAVRQLHDLHGREVLTFLIGVLRNHDAASDVCQVTFQKLLESGHTASRESIRGWLFKVAFHEAMEYRRKGVRNEKALRNLGIDAGGPWTGLTNPAPPLEQLVRDEEVVRLNQLLRQIPDEQRFVVLQRLQENKTFATIAAELNVPLGTVLTRMRLAMEKLRKLFGRDE